MTVATQNVDDLHERAGATVAAHVHGSLFAPRCSDCESPFVGDIDIPSEPTSSLRRPACPVCGGAVRPGVVWFGENLPFDAWDFAERAAVAADVVVVVGTSGVVYPFASLPGIARDAGARVVEINPDETPVSFHAHYVWRTTASVALPDLVTSIDSDKT